MKFKVEKGCELYDRLKALHNRIKQVNAQATELVESLGYTRYCRSHWCIAGGISAIEIVNMPSDERTKWTKMFKQSNLFMPRQNKQNSEIWAKIQALPRIEPMELNDILNFRAGASKMLSWSAHPGVIWKEDYILIDVSDEHEYTPVAGMTEILVSEYNALKAMQ